MQRTCLVSHGGNINASAAVIASQLSCTHFTTDKFQWKISMTKISLKNCTSLTTDKFLPMFSINVTTQIKLMQERECNFDSLFSQYCHNLLCTSQILPAKYVKEVSSMGAKKSFWFGWVYIFSKYVGIPISGTILNSLIFQYPPPAAAWCQYIRSRMSSILNQVSNRNNFENTIILARN